MIWQGSPDFTAWKRPKIPKPPRVAFHNIEKGCPYNCGLCPDHRQRSCTIILEVTDRCDLRCPVCYADAGRESSPDPSVESICCWFRNAWQAAENCNIQLSGGEPALRDDLPEIVRIGRKTGFEFIQINTNGIRLSHDTDYVKALKDAGLASAFLQFDGLDDSVYRKLRGRTLLKEKMAAIEQLEKAGIGIVLVCTVVPGINADSVGDILKTAVGLSPAVRAVHFQPISYFGRYFEDREGKRRITLPELMRGIEIHSGGMFRVEDFRPPGCENARCSFHGNYIIMPDRKVKPLNSPKSCCDTPTDAEQGAIQAISYIARQWASPMKANHSCSSCSCDLASDSENRGLIRMEEFIERARSHTFSVSAMAFQDVWNLDIERVQDCCIHVMAPDGRLIPFCLYNLTASDGKRLYRG